MKRNPSMRCMSGDERKVLMEETKGGEVIGREEVYGEEEDFLGAEKEEEKRREKSNVTCSA
jgi:hypothetical protein